MRAALRHLCEHGVEALKPQKATSKTLAVGSYIAKPSREIWRRPLISKRVAKDLRKLAIKQGTYGTFDTNQGIGWDPRWDLILYKNQYYDTSHMGLQPPKKSARQRTREDRVQKIEENLKGQKDAMEQYYIEKEQARIQDKSFEARYKRMIRGGAGGGGGPR